MKKVFLLSIAAVFLFVFSSSAQLAVFAERASDDLMQMRPALPKVEKSGQFRASDSGKMLTPEQILQKRAAELLVRERNANNTASNSAEALRNFQEKSSQAQKQRAECLKARAGDLQTLEKTGRASASAMLAQCNPKIIQSTVTKPIKPFLDGLTEAEKQSAQASFSAQLKAYSATVQAAVKTCKTKVEQIKLDIREKAVAIKEQCSQTERQVLGLTTDVPYYAQ